MQACVSLWSADLLDVGGAIDLLAEVADGFHLDVFDGHHVDELLFGPDFVAAVRRRTTVPLDVHLNVADPDHWARRFLDVGADMITVQSRPCPDVTGTLDAIRAAGGRASLGIEVGEPLAAAAALAPRVDRFLMMGTAIGIRGAGLDPRTPDRIRELRDLLPGDATELFVDGGIRESTVAALAEAGADGVIPGSLVFAAPDPVAAVQALHRLGAPRSA